MGRPRNNVCVFCNSYVSWRQEALQCDGCNKWQHRKCKSETYATVMSTLQDRLSDPLYKNWVKVGLCLNFVKIGLEKFVDQECQVLHQTILSSIPGSSTGLGTCTTCTNADVRYQPSHYRWKINCPNGICDKDLSQILSHHISPASNKITWRNSDVGQWPSNHWEVATCYMGPGQGGATAADTDVSGLLNLFIHCSAFHTKVPQLKCEKVRDVRNAVMHSKDLMVSSADFNMFMADIKDLLEDPTYLKAWQESKDAVKEIDKVISSAFVISQTDETDVLRQKVDGLEQRLRDLSDEVETTKTDRKEDYDKIFKEVDGLRKVMATSDDLNTLATRLNNIDVKYECLRNRIDQQDVMVNSHEIRLDQQEVKIDAHARRLDQQDLRIDSHEKRLVQQDVRDESFEKRLDQQDLKVNTDKRRIDQQDVKVDSHEKRLDQQDVRADSHEKRLDQQDVKADSHAKRLDQQDVRADSYEKRLDQQDVRADSHEKRLDQQDVKADSHAKRLDQQDVRADSYEKRLDQQDVRADSHAKRLDQQDVKADSHAKRLDQQDVRADSYEKRLDQQDVKADNHEKRLDHQDYKADTHEKRLDQQDIRIGQIQQKVSNLTRTPCGFQMKRKQAKNTETVQKGRKRQKKEEKVELIYERQEERNIEGDIDKIYSEHSEKMGTELSQIFRSDKGTIENFQRKKKRKRSTPGVLQNKGSRVKEAKLGDTRQGPRQRDDTDIQEDIWDAGTGVGLGRDAGISRTEGSRRDVGMEKILSNTRLSLEHYCKRHYVSTGQLQEAKKILDESGCVVISGKPGEGKTTMAYALMSDYDRGKCVSLNDPQQWSDVDVKTVDILLIDDIFGVFRFDPGRFNSWLPVLEKLETFVNNKNLNIVMTTRTDILAECVDKLDKFEMFNCQLDLSSSKLKNEEKKDILLSVLKQKSRNLTDEEIDDCLKKFSSNIGFPYTCHLFASNNKLFEIKSRFFSKPYSFFFQKLGQLDIQKLVALVCLFCFGGRKKMMDFKTGTNKKAIKDMLCNITENMGEEERTASNVSKCNDTLKQMKGVYVEEESEHFVFAHNLVYESVGLIYGKKAPEHVLEVCNLDFLCQCTQQNMKGKGVSVSVSGKINVTKEFYPVLAKRFINEVLNEGERYNNAVGRIAQHSFFNCSEFVIEFLSTLKSEHKEDDLLKINSERLCDQVQSYGFRSRQRYGFGFGFAPLSFDRTFIAHVLNSETNCVNVIIDRCFGSLKCMHDARPEASCWKCVQKWSALTISCLRKSGSVALHLLKMNYPPSIEALMNAMEKKHFNVALLLLQRLLASEVWNSRDKDAKVVFVLSYSPDCPTEIHDLLRKEMEVTLSLVLEAVRAGDVAVLQSVINSLKSFGKWELKNRLIKDAIHTSIVRDLPACRKVLFEAGADVLPSDFVFSMHTRDLASVQDVVMKLKETGTWNPTSKEASVAIEHTYLYNLPDIRDFLLQMGVQVSHKCLYIIVGVVVFGKEFDVYKHSETEMAKFSHSFFTFDLFMYKNQKGRKATRLTSVTYSIPIIKTIIQKLIELGIWDPAAAEVRQAYEITFQMEDPLIRNFLTEAGVPVTSGCLLSAMKSNCTAGIEDAVGLLKNCNQSLPRDTNMKESFLLAIERKNISMIEKLISLGLSVFKECLVPAVKSGSLSAVDVIIKHLKGTMGLLQSDDSIDKTMQMAVEVKNEDRTCTSLNMSMELLVPAVESGNIDMVKYVVKNIQASNRWDCGFKYMDKALKATYDNHKQDIRSFLLTSGAEITPKCLEYAVVAADRNAVRNEADDILAVEDTIKRLKENGKWHPQDKDLHSALNKTYKNNVLFNSHGEINILDDFDLFTLRTTAVCEMDKIRAVILQSGLELTEPFILNAIYERDKETVRSYMMNKKLYSSIHNYTPKHAMLYAYKIGDSDMVELLTSFGIKATYDCLLAAVKSGNVSLVKSAVNDLTVETKLNPNNRQLIKAMIETYKGSYLYCEGKPVHAAVIRKLLMDAGAVITTSVLSAVIEFGTFGVITDIVQNLKDTGRWDSSDMKVITAVESVCRLGKFHVAEVFIENNVEVTPICLAYAVKHESVYYTNKVLQQLQGVNEINFENEHIVKAVKLAYDKHDRLIITTLMASCPEIAYLCLIEAVQQEKVEYVTEVVNYLKGQQKWNPSHRYVSKAMTKCTNSLARKCLLDAGVKITSSCLLWAVDTGDVSVVQEVLDHLQSTGLFDRNDKYTVEALEKAYGHDKIRSVLVAAGVSVTFSCLISAVRSGSKPLVKQTVDLLKPTGQSEGLSCKEKINIPFDNITRMYSMYSILFDDLSMVDRYVMDDSSRSKYVQSDKLDIFENMRSQVSDIPGIRGIIEDSLQVAFLLFELDPASAAASLVGAVKTGYLFVLRKVIAKLQQLKLFNAEDKYVKEALELSYRDKNEGMSELLISNGAVVDMHCLHAAVCSGNVTRVRTLLEKLKRSGNWCPQETSKSMELCCRYNNEDMLSLLLSNGAVVDMHCLHAAVCSGNVTRVRTLIERLKNSGNWRPDETSMAMEDTFFCCTKCIIEVSVPYMYTSVNEKGFSHKCYHEHMELMNGRQWKGHFSRHMQYFRYRPYENKTEIWLKRNTEIRCALIEAGAVITPGCVTAAVLSRSVPDVRLVISALKSDGKWDPYGKEVCMAKYFSDLLQEDFPESFMPSEFLDFIENRDILTYLKMKG